MTEGDEGRGVLVPVLIGVFLLLTGAAWIMANPPGAGPDERAHYLKAVAAGRAELRGRAPTVSEANRRALRKLGQTAEGRARLKAFAAGASGDSPKARWYERTSREFTIPAGLNFSAFGCGRLVTDGWGTCIRAGTSSADEASVRTYVGNYQPYVYVAPGLATRLSSDPLTAMRLGRFANALLSLGLLLIAAFVLYDRSRGVLSLSGLIVALTPAAVFFATTLNPSGPEIAAGICFPASLLRLLREEEPSRAVWIACALSGAVLAVSRSLGPAFLVLDLVVVAALAGPTRVRAAARAAPKPARLTAAAVALAAAAGVFWELRYQPHVSGWISAIPDNIGPSFDRLPRLPKEAVGMFGALDTDIPLSGYILWWLMLGVLLGAAFAVSRGRERALLAALVISVPVVAILVSAVYRQTGFELQARYVLPFAVLVPLWAGELLSLHRERLGRRAAAAIVAGLAGCAAVVHAMAWYSNSQQVADSGRGGAGFLSNSDWTPPLGWAPWVVAFALATVAYAAAGIRAARELR